MALVAALASDVPLLLLDEPTSGLDPLMEQVFAEQVREWASGGGTVLLSSHILSEVEALCDRVTIIRSGRAVETGSLADLRHLRRTRVRAELLGSMDGIASVPGLHDVAVADGVLTCTADPEAINDLLGKLAGIGVQGLTCSPPSLEELSSTSTGRRRHDRHSRRRPATAPAGTAARPRAAAGLGGGTGAELGVVGAGDRRPLPRPGLPAEAAAGINDNPALVAIYGPLADVSSVGSLATSSCCCSVVSSWPTLCSRPGPTSHPAGGGVRTTVVLREHGRRPARAARGGRDRGRPGGGGDRTADRPRQHRSRARRRRLAGLRPRLDRPRPGRRGVTALCCQLTASTRTAGGLVALVLGAGYVLRAVGDLSAGWVSWLSPFGWATQLRPYGDERWWVLALPVLLTAATLAGAVALADRRDVGAGLLPDRPGPARGTMGSVTALTLRLHWGSAVAWGLGILVLGAVMGGIAPGVADLAGSAEVQDMLRRTGGAGALADAFLATEFSFLAVGVTAFAVAAVVRASGEETEGRTESVLATATSRSAVLGAVGLVALAGPVVLMLGFGLGASVTYGAQQDGVGRGPG